MGLYDRDLRALMDEIAGPSPAPGAGAVSGVVIAMAAGLIASAARRSADWPEAKGVSAQAQALRGRVERLAEANEQAYLEALALIEGAAEDGTRDAAIGKALDTAAELPLSIAECAYDVALLGAEAAQHAAPGGAEDAAAAAVLAEAAARASAGLVAANLVSRPGDQRVLEAQRLADAATDAARRAVAASSSR
ncbi:MAG TPA: cyclodeaminase/cyclohydrolase family protein [Gaiellaceae bacterium]|nr:cyclodeaminase/cyclohydrolase family protein [Gaiellaceae bacterium]